MWETAIDQWTRNWNFYTERLTDSILNKFNLNTKRQKRQTNIDFIELTGQNINGSATGPQDIFTNFSPNIFNIWLAMVYSRKDGNYIRNDQYDIIYN